MKRGFLVLVLAAFVAGGVFAVPLSAGGGFAFSGGRIGGVSYGSDFIGANALGFGGFAFFDATFVEASIGFMGGPTNMVMVLDGDRETERSGSQLSLELSLLGKFPFDLGAVTLFPLLGIGGNIVVSASDDDGNSIDDPGDASTFRIKFGAGADFDINDNLFFRVQGLGWYGFPPSFASDLEDAFGGDAAGGFGGSLRLGIGFRF